MINGEGAEERPSSAVTSPCDPLCDRESDGGGDLSHYSSCGGESEFERYCSAGSAMGTPSFRSSSFRDSDFGSLKSFKLGGENTIFKNLGDERLLLGFWDSVHGSGSGGGNEFSHNAEDNGMLSLNGGVEGFVVGDACLWENFDVDGNRGNQILINNENKGNGEGSIGILGDYGETGDDKGCYRSVEKGDDKGGLEIDGGESRNLSDEDEASSRYEHSEGEDSMFGCGSDDERKADFYWGKNIPFPGGESRRNENLLVLNSAVAFGSDDWDDFVQESKENTLGSMVSDEIQTSIQSGVGSLSFTAADPASYPDINRRGQQNEVRSPPVACNQVDAVKLTETHMNTLSMNSTGLIKPDGGIDDVKGVHAPSNEVSDIDELSEYLGCSSGYNIFQKNKDPVKEEAMTNEELKIGQNGTEMENQETNKVIAICHDVELRSGDVGKRNVESDPLSESVVSRHHLAPVNDNETREARLFEAKSSFTLSSLSDATSSSATKKNFAFSLDQIEDYFVPVKAKDFELNDFYDEIVNDMEDILLDEAESTESTASRPANRTRIYQSQFPRAPRDGGSSASTSGTDYAYNSIKQPRKIDRIEVVGARQKKGDVSFSERLVGVQKYTVYKIRVWSGEDHSEVERRYREFSTLYFRLKKLFADHGWTLPSPWSSVERESRKLFGNASPDVVADRSLLIQECLQSVIHHPKFSSGSLNALVDFISPLEGVPDSPASDTSATQSPFPNRGTQMENFPTLGKTISLIVQVHHLKSTKQMLDAQHYRCAGCYRNFDDGRTRVQEFVKALGWGKPRLCEYTGQFFCSSCHNNDNAVLPARVLHYWDFTRYPVSQLAKSFLDSINDQPMLCVSAVNPFLFSKVPTLQHVANVRNRIRAMMPYVRCPFRRSVYKGLGSRKYLLDSNDFFALRDLIELSKGVFSALPVMAETVSRKIQEHITEQCLVCYDVGIPCSARQGCDNPLSLIFPFQEGEVENCRSCKSVFHKKCYKKIDSCPCGARFKQKEVKQSADEGIHDVNINSNLRGGTAEPGNGLLAGLFSKVMPGRSQIVQKQESKGAGDIILMSSLPNTSL